MAKENDEWIGGGAPLPYYITEEGDAPFRPETFLWIDSQGLVVGTTVFRMGEGLTGVADFFRATTRAPAVGAPRVPARVRVASPELAKVLQREIGAESEVICAETPEIDEPLAALVAHMNELDDEPATYLTAGLSVEAVGRLISAAALFYRAKPWNTLDEEDIPVAATIPELGVIGAPISLLGTVASPGFLLFANDDAQARFLVAGVEAAQRTAEGHAPSPMPAGAPHCHLALEPRSEMPPELVEEIARHRWKSVGRTVVPDFGAVDDEGIPRPVTARELAVLEAIAIAIAQHTTDAAADSLAVETSLGLVHVAFAFHDDDGVDGDDFDDDLDEDDLGEAQHLDDMNAMVRAKLLAKVARMIGSGAGVPAAVASPQSPRKSDSASKNEKKRKRKAQRASRTKNRR